MTLATGAAAAADPAAGILGEDRERLSLTKRDELSGVLLALITQTRFGLDILSRELDRTVFDRRELVDAVQRLALRGPRVRIRWLIQQVGAARETHRLIDLARRLSSRIELRRMAPEHRGYPAAFVIADGKGVLLQPLADRYEAAAGFHDPGLARELGLEFARFWDHGDVAPELRRLSL